MMNTITISRKNSKLATAVSSGFVCMSGDKVIGSDIYASRDLFYNQLDPLLKGYCDQAVYMGKPVTITRDDEKKYMDKLLTDKFTQEVFHKREWKNIPAARAGYSYQ